MSVGGHHTKQDISRSARNRKHCKTYKNVSKIHDNKRKVFLVQPHDKRNTVMVVIKGYNTPALVDSGATISCISQTLLKRVGYNNIKYTQSHVEYIVGVNGTQSIVLGTINIPLMMEPKIIVQTFHVISKLQYNLLLGLDFLEHNKAQIDMAVGTLTLNYDIKLPLLNMKQASVRTVSYVRIPPQSKTTVRVQLSALYEHNILLLQPTFTLTNRNLVGADCLIDNQNGYSTYTIFNPSKYRVTIPPNRIIATTSQIDINSIKPIMSVPDTHRETSQTSVDNDTGHTFDLSNSDLTDIQKQSLLTFLKQHRSVFFIKLKGDGSNRFVSPSY
jgi:hypothetical protein